MTRGVTPVTQQRRLRTELRQLREKQKLTQQAVAEALDWSSSKVIRIESGSVGVSVVDVRALLQQYGVTDQGQVDQLVEMARDSKKAAWWHKFRPHFPQQFLTFLGLEASSIRLRQFQGLLVPGLLQTPEYAQALMAAGNNSPEAIERGVDVRIQRQQIVESDTTCWFVLDEATLHRVIGGAEVLKAQLQHLKAMAARDNVTIQVLPFTAGVHRGMQASFEIFELSEEENDYAVLIEGPYRDTLIPDSSDETKEYVSIFFELEKAARPAEETPQIIDRVLKQLGEQQ